MIQITIILKIKQDQSVFQSVLFVIIENKKIKKEPREQVSIKKQVPKAQNSLRERAGNGAKLREDNVGAENVQSQ